MSLERYLWRVQRTDNGLYETEVAETEPLDAPSDGGAINTDQTTIMQSRFLSLTHEGYINLESSLADNQALKINASNAAGGIDMDAGTGGIAIDTTNALSLDAGAASNFTTTAGNLDLRATTGLLNLNGNSGINLGNTDTTSAINVGTAAAARTVTIGNQTGASQTDVRAGTGGFNLDVASGGAISLDATGASCNFTLASTGDAQDLTIALTGANNSSLILDTQGTGADALRFNSGGGIDVDAAGQINVVTSQNAGGAVTFDTSSGGGGITLSSGSFGILMTVAFGGACNIGNDAGTGDIDLGTGARARAVTVGGTTGASQLILRYGTDGLVQYQPSPTSLSNGDATLTIAQLLTGILYMTPSQDRTLTLPTAALAVAGVSNVAVNDSIDFSVINRTGGNSTITVALGTGGGTLFGSGTINPDASGQHYGSGVGRYRMVFTNVTASSEGYDVYRIA